MASFKTIKKCQYIKSNFRYSGLNILIHRFSINQQYALFTWLYIKLNGGFKRSTCQNIEIRSLSKTEKRLNSIY